MVWLEDPKSTSRGLRIGDLRVSLERRFVPASFTSNRNASDVFHSTEQPFPSSLGGSIVLTFSDGKLEQSTLSVLAPRVREKGSISSARIGRDLRLVFWRRFWNHIWKSHGSDYYGSSSHVHRSDIWSEEAHSVMAVTIRRNTDLHFFFS